MVLPTNLGTVPSWLDRNLEVVSPDQPKNYASLKGKNKDLAFILWSFRELLSLPINLTYSQIVGITANACAETGWGKYFRANNLGGVKITKNFVENYKKTHGGKSPSWWRAPGHIASGDPVECYYRAYTNFGEFYSEWVRNFVPKQASPESRYYETGKLFWAGLPWFLELCKAGYKGPVTASKPEQSVRDFEAICRRIKILLCQHVLGLKDKDLDGNWGPHTTEVCKTYQQTRPDQFPTATGELNGVVFKFLLEKWKEKGMKLNFDLV